jgi:hypothetical protein
MCRIAVPTGSGTSYPGFLDLMLIFPDLGPLASASQVGSYKVARRGRKIQNDGIARSRSPQLRACEHRGGCR